MQAFAAGVLSFLGHSPTFALGNFTGSLRVESGMLVGMRVELLAQAESLVLEDKVSAEDRKEIEKRTRGEVLELARYPQILFQATARSANAISPGRYWIRLDGTLSLHGLTRPLVVEAEFQVFEDGIRLRGESGLKMSNFGIKPVTALGGSIKLKDEVKLSFDLAGLPVEPD